MNPRSAYAVLSAAVAGSAVWAILGPNSTPEDQALHASPQRESGAVQRILTEELLYAREFTSEADRAAAISVWNIHYNYHPPHSGSGGLPPASRLKSGVTNVRPSYS